MVTSYLLSFSQCLQASPEGELKNKIEVIKMVKFDWLIVAIKKEAKERMKKEMAKKLIEDLNIKKGGTLFGVMERIVGNVALVQFYGKKRNINALSRNLCLYLDTLPPSERGTAVQIDRRGLI